MTDAFTNVARSLIAAQIRFVVTGVWGANYFAGGSLFVTQDQDVFLPPDADNLLRAWDVLDSLGLRLTANGEPLDQPRDHTLAEAVVRTRSLTCADDGQLLQIDLTLLMTGTSFDTVRSRHRVFQIDGVPIPVADLADIIAAKHAANRPKDRMFLATHAAELRRLLGRAP